MKNKFKIRTYFILVLAISCLICLSYTCRPKLVTVIIGRGKNIHTTYGIMRGRKIDVVNCNMDRFLVDNSPDVVRGDVERDPYYERETIKKYRTTKKAQEHNIGDGYCTDETLKKYIEETAQTSNKVIVQGFVSKDLNKDGRMIIHRLPAYIEVYDENGKEIYRNLNVKPRDIKFKDSISKVSSKNFSICSIVTSFTIDLNGLNLNNTVELENINEIQEKYIDTASDEYTYPIEVIVSRNGLEEHNEKN